MSKIIAIQSNFALRVNVKKRKSFYVGSNVKDIEEGKYDIKITNTRRGVKIFINTFCKEKRNKYLYDEVYIDELTEYIQKICNLNKKILNSEDKKIIKENILDNYILAKSNYNIINGLFIKFINIEFKTQNFQLIVEVFT